MPVQEPQHQGGPETPRGGNRACSFPASPECSSRSPQGLRWAGSTPERGRGASPGAPDPPSPFPVSALAQPQGRGAAAAGAPEQVCLEGLHPEPGGSPGKRRRANGAQGGGCHGQWAGGGAASYPGGSAWQAGGCQPQRDVGARGSARARRTLGPREARAAQGCFG